MIVSFNRSPIRSFAFMICISLLFSCRKREYQGYVYEKERHIPLKGVVVRYGHQQVLSDENGHFIIEEKDELSDAITFFKKNYKTDSAKTIIIHSGEKMDEQFKNGNDTVFLSRVQAVALQSSKPAKTKLTAIEWPITSQQFKKFYKVDKEARDYTLVVPEGYNLETYTDVKIPVQESPFGYEIKPNNQHLTAAQFQLSGIDCKIIVYNVTGENDRPVLNIQLNSYNKKGEVQDALLLDSRFTFEIVYFRDFSIEKSGIINLNLFQKELYTYNDQGDITGSIENPQIQRSKVSYRMQSDGKFKKLTPDN